MFSMATLLMSEAREIVKSSLFEAVRYCSIFWFNFEMSVSQEPATRTWSRFPNVKNYINTADIFFAKRGLLVTGLAGVMHNNQVLK